MAVWQVKTKSGTWVTMPTPAQGGMNIADEPIWSSNTGRGATALMTGDIVGWKTTIDMDFPPLSFAESKRMRDVLKDEVSNFFQVRYKDFDDSEWESGTFYTANLPRTIYSINQACQWHTGVKIQLVEQ